MDDHIRQLLSRYFQGQLALEEKDTLYRWLKSSPGHEQEAYRMYLQWENGETHDLFDEKAAWERFLRSMEEKSRVERRLPWRWISIAAAITALIVSVLFVFFDGNRQKDTVAYSTVFAPYGEVTKVALGDGSTAWLKGGTKLSIPSLSPNSERHIRMDGEAYFEVKHDESCPFVVTTSSGMKVRVLGTHFELRDFKGKAVKRVVLMKGSVQVVNRGESFMMHPDEMLEITKGKPCMRTVHSTDYRAWITRLYVADNQPLKDILAEISEHYGKAISCDEDAAHIVCSGQLDLSGSIDEVMQSIAVSAPIRVQKNGAGYKVTRE